MTKEMISFKFVSFSENLIVFNQYIIFLFKLFLLQSYFWYTITNWLNQNDRLVAKNKTTDELESNNNNEDDLIAGPLSSISK